MGEVTTFCSLWRLDLSTGRRVTLTDHDDEIFYEGDHYHPQQGATALMTESRSGLSVDSGGMKTRIDLPGISTQAIQDGILDEAELFQYRHDWRSGETRLLSRGRIGEVSISGPLIEVEWLGQASLLNQSTGRVFSRQCDASFGDARCGVDRSRFASGTECPRTFTACRDSFGNEVNFRGFPYLLGDDALQASVREGDRRDGSSRYQ